MRVHGILFRSVIAAAVGVPALPTPAGAATLAIKDHDKRRGAEIAQSFLDSHGENVSVVTTRHGASCIASRTLQISDSVYTAPIGAGVPFNNVTRSPATSIQAIARPDAAVAFRIQLKYSPDRSKPVEMQIDDRIFDLATALEPSSDSVLVEGEVAQVLAKALRGDAGPIMRAVSGDTGRVVEDRLAAPDMTGLDSCLETLKTPQVQDQLDDSTASLTAPGLDEPDTNPTPNVLRVNNFTRGQASADTAAVIDTQDRVEPGQSRLTTPEPVMEMRVDFIARPDPDTRISPNKLENCRMRDIPETVFLGRLTGVSGFFSQTRDVYVAFDDDGQVQRAYIPGIFDADLTSGRGRARASLAADYNLPDRPNTVKGCLGDAPLDAHVCVISGRGDDHYSLVECDTPNLFGALEDFVPPVLEPSLIGDTDIFGMPVANLTTPGDGGADAFLLSESQTVLPRISSLSPGTPTSGVGARRFLFPEFFGRSGLPRLSSRSPGRTVSSDDDGRSLLPRDFGGSRLPILGSRSSGTPGPGGDGSGGNPSPGPGDQPVSSGPTGPEDNTPLEPLIPIDVEPAPISGDSTVFVASMPLPATLWMLIGSLGGFFLLRRIPGRKRSSSPTL